MPRNGEYTLHGAILHRLLQEAKEVSVILAIAMDTGYILLQEYADASRILFKNKIPKVCK